MSPYDNVGCLNLKLYFKKGGRNFWDFGTKIGCLWWTFRGKNEHYTELSPVC